VNYNFHLASFKLAMGRIAKQKTCFWFYLHSPCHLTSIAFVFYSPVVGAMGARDVFARGQYGEW
jgi:hypothetical protein